MLPGSMAALLEFRALNFSLENIVVKPATGGNNGETRTYAIRGELVRFSAVKVDFDSALGAFVDR
jgi:hypothetical protein